MTDTTPRYPQPREGITGTDRTDDDLLALDDKALARRLLMIGTASCLHSAVLVGDPAPVVAEMYARMRAPQPGDLVMEAGTPYSKDLDTQIKGFGILIEHRKEWAATDEEWAAEVAEWAAEATGDDGLDLVKDRRAVRAWYIQYGPAAEDVCRWTNCEFIAVPTDHRTFYR